LAVGRKNSGKEKKTLDTSTLHEKRQWGACITTSPHVCPTLKLKNYKAMKGEKLSVKFRPKAHTLNPILKHFHLWDLFD